MQFYMAPMEGLTGFVYRNAYHKNFGDVDKYFTPFLQGKKLSTKEIRDILPEHNVGMQVVPQILTNRAEEFCATAAEVQQYGYQTVNLNLGCPSGTVVARNRGAGFLALPEELDRFLSEIFDKCPTKISIKTRIGIENPMEWEQLLKIYERYPMEELIIHPRLQKDFYKNTPNREAFFEAARENKMPLCYNGDIHTKRDYAEFMTKLSEEKGIAKDRVTAVMLGRGLMKNPGLIGEIRGQERVTKEKLRSFHDDVLEGYLGVMSGERNTLFRMKELWSYLGQSFAAPEKTLKKIRKAQRITEYTAAVNQLFLECELMK